MKYLDVETGEEIIVYPYQTKILKIMRNNPSRYHELFEE